MHVTFPNIVSWFKRNLFKIEISSSKSLSSVTSTFSLPFLFNDLEGTTSGSFLFEDLITMIIGAPTSSNFFGRGGGVQAFRLNVGLEDWVSVVSKWETLWMGFKIKKWHDGDLKKTIRIRRKHSSKWKVKKIVLKTTMELHEMDCSEEEGRWKVLNKKMENWLLWFT